MAGTVKYNHEYHDDWAWSLAIRGATDKEIGDAFGVSVRTINRWKSSHPSFLKKMEEGKSGPNAKVEASLYKRAVGFSVEESERIIEWNSKGEQKPVRIKNTTRYVAPDTMAIMYWLNNRSKKTGEWTQRQEVSVGFENDEKVLFILPEIDE